jgi:L-amino acid N-acyltransferase YncA
MDETGSVRVRDSEEADTQAIARIYGHWVQHGLASFELTPPDANEIRRRRAAVLAGGYPHIVAAGGDGRILGYAYAGPYRARPAYRFACEDSVYVAPEAGRRGVGRILLQELIARCEAQGLRLMVAIIGDSGNEPSIGLHRALGFARAGVLPAIGWKHRRWVDTVLMVRALGAGASLPPVERATERVCRRQPQEEDSTN